MKNLEIAVLLDYYGEMLTDKQRLMIEYYYNSDLSLSEIAENEKITRQGVRDSIKRAENQLLEMERKLGFVAKLRSLNPVLEDIQQAAQEIANVNVRYGCSREINNLAESIYNKAETLKD